MVSLSFLLSFVVCLFFPVESPFFDLRPIRCCLPPTLTVLLQYFFYPSPPLPGVICWGMILLFPDQSRNIFSCFWLCDFRSFNGWLILLGFPLIAVLRIFLFSTVEVGPSAYLQWRWTDLVNYLSKSVFPPSFQDAVQDFVWHFRMKVFLTCRSWLLIRRSGTSISAIFFA